MRSKIFNSCFILFMVLAATMKPAFAQVIPPPTKPVIPLPPVAAATALPETNPGKTSTHNRVAVKVKIKKLEKIAHTGVTKTMVELNKTLARINVNTDVAMNIVMPPIAYGFNEPGNDFNFQNNDPDQDANLKEATKTYSKSYPADANDRLEINNRFGKITINTWDKNEFKVDVQIKVAANDDEAAEKLLDKVNIIDSKVRSNVSFMTKITQNAIAGEKSLHKMEINYTVYMPAKNALTIINKYGSTILPDFDGKITINNSYGSITAKSLTNSDNAISVKYGNASIVSLDGSNLDVAYGSLNLDAANKLNADVQYGSAKIGKLSTSGNINIKYGGLQISDLDKNMKALSVNSNYAPVKVNLTTNTNADFDVTVHYASFSYSDNAIIVTSKTPADEKGFSSTQTYKGHIGKGSTDKTIIIKSNFGGVNFD